MFLWDGPTWCGARVACGLRPAVAVGLCSDRLKFVLASHGCMGCRQTSRVHDVTRRFAGPNVFWAANHRRITPALRQCSTTYCSIMACLKCVHQLLACTAWCLLLAPGSLAMLSVPTAGHIQEHDPAGQRIEPADRQGQPGTSACSGLSSLHWVRDYAAWHAMQRQNPNAQYLLYLCGAPSWDASVNATAYRGCSGLGDRLRGMMEMIRLAAFSRRVLLYHWSIPFQLESVLAPGAIDWQVKHEYNLDVSSAPLIRWNNDGAQPPELADGSWREIHANERLVVMILKQRDPDGSVYPYMPNLGGVFSDQRACIFQYLFQPDQSLQEEILAERGRLFGDAQKPYVAVHLRLGGLQGETQSIVRFDQLKGFLAALACARAMASAVHLTDAPVLLITDNDLLRRMVAANFFTGVVGPPVGDAAPAHLDLATSADSASHRMTFVDLGLLSQASCLISSRSGFSYTSWYWGQQGCHKTVTQCLDLVQAQKHRILS